MFAEVNEGIRWFQAQGRWIDAAEEPGFRPTPGTLIFFDWDEDSNADHVGVVERCKKGRIYTIEGNSNDSVLSNYYTQDNNIVLGFAIINVNKKLFN